MYDVGCASDATRLLHLPRLDREAVGFYVIEEDIIWYLGLLKVITTNIVGGIFGVQNRVIDI